MRSKRKLLKDSRLCVILDRELIGESCIAVVARRAILGGADMIQLRTKRSSSDDMIRIGRSLKRIAGNLKVPLIINDRLDAAIALGADGLHIGSGDIGLGLARRLLGPDKIIGVSVKNERQAAAAKAAGADYLGVGPVFATPIKAAQIPKGIGLLKRVKCLGIPFFAIGGIGIKNAKDLAGKGFNRIAVIRAICATDDPFKAAKRLKKAIFQDDAIRYSKSR